MTNRKKRDTTATPPLASGGTPRQTPASAVTAASSLSLGSNGRPTISQRALLWATTFKPLFEVAALLLGGSWFLSQCATGDFTPAAELTLEVARTHDVANAKVDHLSIKANFKVARAMVELRRATLIVDGVEAQCPDLKTIEAAAPTISVPAGDSLSFACVVDVAPTECRTITATLHGTRAFSFLKVWRLPDRAPWGKSSWRAAAATCPTSNN